MWNSVEGLTSIIATANWGIVLALLVALALSLVSVVSGSRRDTLLQIADSAQEEQIADGRTRVAEANARAAQLEAAAAQARLDQEKLREQNLELQVRVERERFERLKLEALIGPRSLSPVQRKTLVAILEEGRGKTVSLRALNSTPESAAYAEQLREVFVEAGWQAAPVLYGVVGDTDVPTGLVVVQHTVPNATTMAVRKALGEAGVAATYRSDHRLVADQILIVVGQKPAP